jgi:hypothetical protein
MKTPLRLLVFALGWTMAFGAPLQTVENDPFVAKFGGPYKNEVSQEFRKNLLEYAAGLRSTFAVLGVSGLKDKESFKAWTKEFIDPSLAKLDPKTDAEKKLKAEAVYVKQALAFTADPTSIPEAERKVMADFLDACLLPDQTPTESNKAADMLTRFSAQSLGMSMDEMQETLKKFKKQ